MTAFLQAIIVLLGFSWHTFVGFVASDGYFPVWVPPPPPVEAQVVEPGWQEIVASYSWPLDQALAIVWCESRNDPNAYNPSGATGLFQIMNGSYDPATNIAQAWAKYQDGVRTGNPWKHWNLYGGCGHF